MQQRLHTFAPIQKQLNSKVESAISTESTGYNFAADSLINVCKPCQFWLKDIVMTSWCKVARTLSVTAAKDIHPASFSFELTQLSKAVNCEGIVAVGMVRSDVSTYGLI